MITIYRSSKGYTADVNPPQGNNPYGFTIDEPMTREELIFKLMELGCHQTDIGDALKFVKQKGDGS